MNNLLYEMKKKVEEGLVQGQTLDSLRVVLKEYLQYFVLDFLYHSKLSSLIFYGGSCLRILYELPRMSEDLDFESDENINLEILKEGLEKYFHGNIFMKNIKININKEKKIRRFILTFPIMADVGLSKNPSETLKLKIEIRPESKQYMKQMNVVTTPISKFGKTFILRHYDRPTLMATKIAAILGRSKKGFHRGHFDEGIHFKGRDFYDLLWYMEQGILPNEKALKANGITGSIEAIFDQMAFQIGHINLDGIQKDIEPLFVNQQDAHNWINVFRDTFTRFHRERYKAKKKLKLADIALHIEKHSFNGEIRIQFVSEKNEYISFEFHLSDYFLLLEKGEITEMLTDEELEKTRFLSYWKTDERKKKRMQAFAALFLKKIHDYIKRHNGGVYFEKWQSKLICTSTTFYSEKKIILSLNQLQSKNIQLENLVL